MNVAVIDSGIYDKGDLTGKVIAKIKFTTEDENRNYDGRSAVLHGTACAEIISRICPQVQFLDLTAMCRDGTAEVSKLLEALDWCIQNRIKLIHLSVGTVNYFDIKPLEDRIRCLTDQNTIIVAAYHNRNIRTYPAAFPRVFGVRQDRKGILEENQFIFQKQAGYEDGNSIVAHWRGEEGRNSANSYAAPVITGFVARMLNENEESDYSDVLAALKKIAVSDKQYPDKIGSVFQSTGQINIPVIAGMGLCQGEMRMLTDIFKSKGYHTLLLQEKAADITAVPMEYYGGKDILLGQILHTVEIVYTPDIVFLDLQSRDMYDSSKKADIDMCLSYDCETSVQNMPCNSCPVPDSSVICKTRYTQRASHNQYPCGADFQQSCKLRYNITAERMLEIKRKPGEIFGIIFRYFT